MHKNNIIFRNSLVSSYFGYSDRLHHSQYRHMKDCTRKTSVAYDRVVTRKAETKTCGYMRVVDIISRSTIQVYFMNSYLSSEKTLSLECTCTCN